MGDKISAASRPSAAGVAGVPGHDRVRSRRPTKCVAFGESHGWPVAIKAAYGGGGRGMKVVRRPSRRRGRDRVGASARPRRTSAATEVYVERYLTWPRHVEMQIIGDTHGNVVWVGERDCSAQRRHQKLIEESPGSRVLPTRRAEAMGEAAVTVATVVGYYNAGTVEFLYPGRRVLLPRDEHPAAGRAPGHRAGHGHRPRRRADPCRVGRAAVVRPRTIILRRGHAIECRINAENPAGGRFLPSPGRITKLVVPARLRRALRRRLRVGRRGQPVLRQPHRQAHRLGRRPRPRAIARMLRALGEMQVEGVATTIPADLAILAHPDFVAADALDEVGRGACSTCPAIAAPARGRRAPTADERRRRSRRDVDVEVNGKRFAVQRVGARVAPPAAGGGRRRAARPATARRRRPRRAAAVRRQRPVTVPMQGTIVKVLVAVGDAVEVGQAVCVLEAMKMENNITAERAGTVKEVKVAAGQTVGSGDVVVVIG